MFIKKYDYNGMRFIDDVLYAELVKILSEDAKVRAFQKLVLAPKAEPTDKPDEFKTDEVNENGIQQSNA